MYNQIIQNKIVILFVLLWVGIWGSLNTFVPDFEYLQNTFSKEGISKNIIYSTLSALRFYLPIFFSIIFYIYLIFFKKINFKANILVIFYTTFFLSQILGLIFYDFSEFNLERNFLPLFGINTIILLYFANQLLDSKQLRKFFFVNIVLLITISFFYLPNIYKDYFSNPHIFFYNTQTWRENVFDDPMIRVTGLSRVLGLVLIFLIVLLDNINSKKNKFYLIFLLILLTSNIWALQSRGVFICLVFVLFVYTLFISNKKFFQNIILYIFIFSLALMLFKVLQYSKKIYIEKHFPFIYELYLENTNQKQNRLIEAYSNIKSNSDEKDINSNSDEKDINSNSEEKDNIKIRYVTSSRNEIWKKIINSYEYNRIFGYGPQADRYVILKSKQTIELIDNKLYFTSGFMTNASSSLLYSFICGGYVGLILFCLLNLYILGLLAKYFKNRKNLIKEKIYVDCLSLILLFIGVRSFFENSHAVFSLDFIMLISCAIMLEKELKKL